ncbi:hypothetical protein [Sulfurimonas sp.]
MTQLNNFNTTTSQVLRNSDDDVYIYNGVKVKIITVFNDSRESTALIENENGEILQVPKNSLRHDL